MIIPYCLTVWRAFFPLFAMFAILPVVSAWDRVITFEAFDSDFGVFDDPSDPIAQLVRITRAPDAAERYGSHYVLPGEPDPMAYYGLATEGFGEHRGRLDAAIELDTPITGEGTLYIRYQRFGWRTSMALGLSPEAVTADTGAPWGWSGPIGPEARAAGVVNRGYWLLASDGPDDRLTSAGLPAWTWHEIWMTVDVPAGVYRVYIRSGAFPEQTLVREACIDGAGDGAFAFRNGSVDALRSIQISTDAGPVERPNWGNEWYLDMLAVDATAHNLSDPPGVRGEIGVVVDQFYAWGLLLWESGVGGAPEVWVQFPPYSRYPGHPDGKQWEITEAPWVFNASLNTWMWVELFSRTSPGYDVQLHEPGLWVNLVNQGVPERTTGETKWGFPVDEDDPWLLDGGDFLGRFDARHVPWVYSYNEAIWIWVDTLAGVDPSDGAPAAAPRAWAFLKLPGS